MCVCVCALNNLMRWAPLASVETAIVTTIAQRDELVPITDSRPWRFILCLSESNLSAIIAEHSLLLCMLPLCLLLCLPLCPALQIIALLRCAPTNHIHSNAFSAYEYDLCKLTRAQHDLSMPNIYCAFCTHANNANCVNGRRDFDILIKDTECKPCHWFRTRQ